ncbi:ribonuclease P protein component [bacterium]|nr:MAG: ribonuclease P protein component [bacterium]
MLSKNNRLSKKDFEIAFKKRGKFVKLSFLTFKITENHQNIIRFGISCGTKISKKAVARNKIKRRLNESLRLNLGKIKKGYDILVMPSPEIVKKTYQEINQSILIFFKQSDLLN